MEEISLRDPEQDPTTEILKNVLGRSYQAYDELMQVITGQGYNLEPVWNFYKDGKAWLCKVVNKKKTVCWISVWDSYFKVAFYFTEKSAPGIYALNIEERIKTDFKQNKPVGKLLPLMFEIKNEEQIADLIRVIDYKNKIK